MKEQNHSGLRAGKIKLNYSDFKMKDQILTETMLCEAIAMEKKWKLENFQVNDVKITEGSKKGDNYAAVLRSIEIQVTNQLDKKNHTFYYMAKIMPPQEMKAKWLRKSKVFDMEVSMYKKVLPALKKTGRSVAKKLSFPKVYFADADIGVIIMENLKKKQYYLQDKVIGLNDDQIKLVLNQLACLHATSYHLGNTYEGGMEKFKKDFEIHMTDSWMRAEAADVQQKMGQMMDMVQNIFVCVIEEHCKSKDPKLVNDVKTYCRSHTFISMEGLHAPEGKFICMIHNDAWCNNFLFRDDENRKTDNIKILDLQLSRWARPTIDLVYFLCSSTKPTWRKLHLDSILKHYYCQLMESLNTLGHNGEELYPWADFKKDFDECYPFGYLLAQMHNMLQLTNPNNKDAVFDTNREVDLEVKTEMEKFIRTFMEGQLKEARENKDLREGHIGLAEEGRTMGLY